MRREFIFFLLIVAGSYAFSIDSYFNHATILPNGDLHVSEYINFTLEKQYDQGFRTIRPADAPSPDSVALNYVKVNGAIVPSYVDMYNGETEIVWNTTYAGPNQVELDYVLKNMTTIWDDYARVCYEHFGAGWSVSAAVFSSEMDLPPGSAGQTVHFQIYSQQVGNATLQGLSVITTLDDVQPGNFIGGCYLFPKNTVNTTNVMNGSAFQILQDERASYGSVTMLAPDPPTPVGYLCIPIAGILVLLAILSVVRHKAGKKQEENIIPPSDEQPAVVAAIVKNDFPEKDLLAATLLDLINRNYIDIIELENKGEESATVKRQRTVLTLKKTGGLLPHEQAVIGMVFADTKEVELDEKSKKLDSIYNQDEAKKTAIYSKMEEFRNQGKAIVEAKGDWLKNPESNRLGVIVTLAIFAFIIGMFVVMFAFIEYDNYNYYNELWLFWAIIGCFPLSCIAYIIISIEYLKPVILKGHEDEYAQWDAFSRAVRSSRLKTYPPGSVVIWGKILVYATALGLADNVSRHLSELDALTIKRMQSMERVRISSYAFYTSSVATSNLARYGDRSGPRASSGSSGGWSSGGGGFSGGSSGGGGFR